MQTPFNLTLEGPDGTYIGVIVGGPLASVEWVRDEPWECRVSVSSDHADDVSPIEFAGNRQYSELERRWWIDAAVARGAVRHYFNTGDLTSTVRWEPF